MVTSVQYFFSYISDSALLLNVYILLTFVSKLALRAREMSRLFYIGGDQVHVEQKSAIFKTNIWKRILSDFPKRLNTGPELHIPATTTIRIMKYLLLSMALSHNNSWSCACDIKMHIPLFLASSPKRIISTLKLTANCFSIHYDWKVAQETKQKDGSAASEHFEGYKFDVGPTKGYTFYIME